MIATFGALTRSAGVVTDRAGVIVQVNFWLADLDCASVAVTVSLSPRRVVGMPDIAPVLVLRVTPAGSRCPSR